MASNTDPLPPVPLPRVDASYPGTDQHQAVLHGIVEFYQDDVRVRALAVFGSLGRGDWRPDSDLDIDIVTTDDAEIDVERELARVCASLAPLGEQAALIISRRVDEGDVVLESLLQLSIRYHPLRTTSPNILDGLRVLAGTLDQQNVEAAARANRRPTAERSAASAVDECLNNVVTAERALRLGDQWLAIELVHQSRGVLMDLFRRKQGRVRPIRTFDAEAPPELKVLLGATLPTYDAAPIRAALTHMLDLLDRHLGTFTQPGTTLTRGQRSVLQRLRTRLETVTPTT